MGRGTRFFVQNSEFCAVRFVRWPRILGVCVNRLAHNWGNLVAKCFVGCQLSALSSHPDGCAKFAQLFFAVVTKFGKDSAAFAVDGQNFSPGVLAIYVPNSRKCSISARTGSALRQARER